MSELWRPGTELPHLVRAMTAERMRWYADALQTVVLDSTVPVIAAPNIHTDDRIARDNGLPSRVADGMISTNWISSALTEAFGEGYLRGGSLRTRYVRPIFEDERIEVVVRITERTTGPDGVDRLQADVACLKDDGSVATAGAASVRLSE